MQHYELTYIITVKFLDDGLTKIVSSINSQIKKYGGTITSETNLNKQRLAYPIQQTHQGTYLLAEFDMEQEQMKKLDNELKLTPEVLRHLIIKKKIKTAAEKEREAKIQEGLRRAKEAELNKLEATSKTAIKKEEIISEPKREKPATPKATLEDLDKKLDELLKSDIL